MMKWWLILWAGIVAQPAYAQAWVVSKPTGPHFAADMAENVLTEVYRRLGVPVRFEAIPLSRSLYMLNRGELDADLFRATQGHPEYPDALPVRVPVVSDDMVAYGVGHVLKVKGWPSLQPYRLVTVRGVKEIEQLGVEYRVEYVNASEQAFKMIDAGRADLAIFSRGAQCMPVLLGLKRIQIQEPAIQKFHFYHHVHRRHQAWIPKIEAELSRMQKDGSWLRIQDETRKRWVRCP